MGYDKAIYDEMLRQGHEVDMFDERSVKSSFSKGLFKIFPGMFTLHTNSYYRKIISATHEKQYDVVFFIKCDMPSPAILRSLRASFPQAKFCLYLWDSLENVHGIKSKIPLFDYVSSFDRKDCETHKLHFRPLFFCKEYENDKAVNNELTEKKYDISFIGTIHSDRYKILKRVYEEAEARNMHCFYYLYLQKKYLFYLYKFIKREFRKAKATEFSFKKLSSNEISKIVDQSKAIIDIQHPKQTGLTMRTIEMIGMKKKFITTNENIKEYDFYLPQNILVINRDNPVIDADFFKTDYVDIAEEIYYKYGITEWVHEVIDAKWSS